MKTLKFIIAVAAAVGLAVTSQAEGQTVTTSLSGSIDFESMNVGDLVTGETQGFAYFGNAGENDSVVVAGGANSTGKALQVSVGDDPLLRRVEASAVDLSDVVSLNIDTMMQFSLTPANESVAIDQDDKLKLYLKAGDGVTNLMVAAAAYVEGAYVTTNVVVTGENLTVLPDTWHNVKIAAQQDESDLVYFLVSVDDIPLVASEPLYNGDETCTKFPSLLGSTVSTVQYVGFSGECMVDELSLSTESVLDTVAFTLTWSSGCTPLSYTIDNGTPVAIEGGTASPLVINVPPAGGDYAGAVVRFRFTNADGVQKELVSSAVTAAGAGLNTADAVYTWTDYLGAAVDGAYTIDDANDVMRLQNGVIAGLSTEDVTFRQTDDIDMTGVTGFYGIGWFTSSDNKDPSITLSGNILFEGTYDGNGRTISNVTVVKHNYAGIFNCISDATIKDLVVSNVAFSGTCSSSGFAVVGNSYSNSVIANVTAGRLT